MLGIIGAMSIEIDGLIKNMSNCRTENYFNLNFMDGDIDDRKIVVVCSGIGKVNAALAATAMICKFPVDTIINIGVAGGIGKSLHQGDIVLGQDCVQHDYDQTPDGLPIGQINGMPFTEFPCTQKVLYNLESVIKKNKFTYQIGTIATGDQFINSNQKTEWLSKTFNAVACDMESAAIAQICYLTDRQFVSMRAISDNGGEKAILSFYDFVLEAAKKSIAVITDYIKHFA